MKMNHGLPSTKKSGGKSTPSVVHWVIVGAFVGGSFGGTAMTIVGGIIGLLLGMAANAGTHQENSGPSESAPSSETDPRDSG